MRDVSISVPADEKTVEKADEKTVDDLIAQWQIPAEPQVSA
jgi:sulfur carrier protein ThiS